MSTAIDALLLRHEVEQFLFHEADLLDTRQFESWLDLLADDIRYWMPVTRNCAFGDWDSEYTSEQKDLNWFDEGKFELEQRVKQILTGKHWAEEPVSRTSHLISNLQVRERPDGLLAARSCFVVYRNRTEVETDLFIGKREDWLRRRGPSFQITRRVVLLDQGVLQAKNLTTFF